MTNSCNNLQQNATDSASQLTAPQLQALGLILQGLTLAETADRLGVNRSTVHRWANGNVHFMRCLQAGRRRHFAEVTDRVRGLFHPSIDQLQTILSSHEAAAPVRLRAALAVLKMMEQPGEELIPGADARLTDRFEARLEEMMPEQAKAA